MAIKTTTVSPVAQSTWPLWWKTTGMSLVQKAGDEKFVFFDVPAALDLDALSKSLAVGDKVQWGEDSIAITEVYRAGFDIDKAGFPRGSIKPRTIGIFYKAESTEPYTLQAKAVANILGLQLTSAIGAEAAILAKPQVKEVDNVPVKNVVVTTPVGSGLPDTINQLSQFAIIGALVYVGIMAFNKYAR